jgi:two-component system, response regulator, stage 0 sporulation protein F
MLAVPTDRPVIILVDDEPDVLQLLSRIIHSLTGDYAILTCARGDTALDQVVQQPTRLVITDYNLPGMNGLQLTAAIKARTPATRIVLITAYATADLARRAQERGVDHLLSKPFQLDTLIPIVQALLV